VDTASRVIVMEARVDLPAGGAAGVILNRNVRVFRATNPSAQLR
jgi:hypothetical protein